MKWSARRTLHYCFLFSVFRQKCLKFVQDLLDCLKDTPEAKVLLPVVVFVDKKTDIDKPDMNYHFIFY